MNSSVEKNKIRQSNTELFKMFLFHSSANPAQHSARARRRRRRRRRRPSAAKPLKDRRAAPRPPI